MEPKRRPLFLKASIVFLILCVLVLIAISSHVLSTHLLENLAAGDTVIIDFIHTHRVLSVIIFGLLFIAAATVSLPVESALCIVAGYYFGAVLGTVISVFSATAGAVLIFFLIKRFFKNSFRARFQSKAVENIMQGLGRDPFGYILFLRLVPLFPYFVINLALSFSDVRAREYIVATFIGIIPAATIFVLTGTQLATIKETGEFLTLDNFGVLFLLALFSLIPLLFRRFFGRDTLAS